MKINIEIDCTPEEARHFFGLPDLRPMQQAVMARIEQQVVSAMSSMAPDAMARAWLPSWLPFNGMSPEQVQKAMASLMNASFGLRPESDKQP